MTAVELRFRLLRAVSVSVLIGLTLWIFLGGPAELGNLVRDQLVAGAQGGAR